MLTNEQLIDEDCRGIRPALGYPACPNHTEKATLFRLLDATNVAGITLTESFRQPPRPAGISPTRTRNISASPRSNAIRWPITPRKGMSLPDMERWLPPNLNYDSDAADRAAVTAA